MQGTLFVNAAHPGPVQLQGGTLGGNGTIGTVSATERHRRSRRQWSRGSARHHCDDDTGLHACHPAQWSGCRHRLRSSSTRAAIALGGATLNLQVNYVPALGQTFTIVNDATGTFAGLPEGGVDGEQQRRSAHHVPRRRGFRCGPHSGRCRPTITGLTDQTILAGNTLGPLAFTVGDDQTPPAISSSRRRPSNQSLLPNAVILLGGSGAARTLTATPILGASGTTVITVTVTDEAPGCTAQQAFMLTVQPRPATTRRKAPPAASSPPTS